MTLVPDTGQLIYFGKLPTRGDFVKSRSGSRVLDLLDTWITQGLERLAVDPGWKAQYDESPHIDFGFLATQQPFVLAGRLAPSADSSQRRFPFIAAASSQAEAPMQVLARSPLCLFHTWQTIERHMLPVLSAEDPKEALETLGAVTLPPETDTAEADRIFTDFAFRTSLREIDELLRAGGHQMSLRRVILALGLLLTPVLTTPGAKPDKGLMLPLPSGPEDSANVAALWMSLIAPFLSRGNFELGVFFQRKAERPMMVVAFDGANAGALQALFAARDENNFLIDICAAEWVEDYVENDYAIKKLSSYLDMPPLSIRQATDTFREAFLGT